MAEERWFELNDDVGLDADGNPEPIVQIGAAVAVPKMKDGEVVEIVETVSIKPVEKGTRIVKTDDPRVVAALIAHGGLHEIEQPKKSDLTAAKKDTQASVEAAGTREEE